MTIEGKEVSYYDVNVNVSVFLKLIYVGHFLYECASNVLWEFFREKKTFRYEKSASFQLFSLPFNNDKFSRLHSKEAHAR